MPRSNLRDGQYDLDGHRFGGPGDTTTVLTDGDATEAAETRTQDRGSPDDNTIAFGRDTWTAGKRELTMLVHAPDGMDARPEVARIKAAWRPRVGATPGSVSVLRWRVGGVTYRSLGRARGAAAQPQTVNDPSTYVLVAEWQPRDAVTYLDAADYLDLTLLAPDSTSAVVLPFTLPTRLGAGPAHRTGLVTVAGTAPTFFRAVITGPSVGAATNISLSGSGWRLDFGALPLLAGQELTIDTARRTALIGGTSVAGYLQRGGSLRARLTPGRQEFVLGATDPSNSTRATVIWHAADHT